MTSAVQIFLTECEHILNLSEIVGCDTVVFLITNSDFTFRGNSFCGMWSLLKRVGGFFFGIVVQTHRFPICFRVRDVDGCLSSCFLGSFVLEQVKNIAGFAYDTKRVLHKSF